MKKKKERKKEIKKENKSILDFSGVKVHSSNLSSLCTQMLQYWVYF
jgi:hypothetical protein